MDDREKREEEELFSATAQLKKKRKDGKPGSKRWISLVALVVIVGLAVGGYYLSGIIVPKAAEPEESTAYTTDSYLILNRDKAEFVSARVQTATEDYTILRSGDAYAVQGMSAFTLDQSKANNLATSCTYLYVNDIAESAENLADYGLAQPSATVTAKYSDGSTMTFLLGDKAPSGSRYYMKLANDPKIYTVFSSTGDRFTTRLQSMHVMPTLSVASDAIQNVIITRPGNQVLEFGYSSEVTLGISSIRVKQPFDYEADSEDVGLLFESIAGIALTGFEADAMEETLPLYGMDNPRYVLEVTGKGTNAAGESVMDAVLMTLWVGKDKDSNSTYVRIDESNKIYLASRSSLSFLSTATAAEIVDRFANIINITKVEAIHVEGPELSTDLLITRTPELDANGNQATNANGQAKYIDDFTIDGEFCDDTTFRKLYQIIIGTRVDGLIPEGKIPAEDVEPVFTVRYRLNEVRDEEIVEYLPYDQDYYAVRRNGVCLFYIYKTRVHQIPNALSDIETGTFEPTKYGV